MKKVSTTLPERCLTINELKDAFFSLKISKSTGADEISFNVIKNCFGELSDILRYVFDLSLQTGIFPDPLKIAKLLVNEKIYWKQFGFQKGHSTEHAMAQLADKIHESFENDNYTLGVFIDLSKAFENYGIKDTNLAWFRSYLTNRKQYIQITNDSKSDLRNTTCGVPQGSILGSLLFLVYANDLPSSSKILNLIMFAEDTNLFYEHKNIIKLFATLNKEYK